MCGIWNREQWEAAIRGEKPGYEGDYTLVKTLYNEAGERALLIQNTRTNDYIGVPDDEGTMVTHYWTKEYNDRKPASQLKLVTKSLNERGFTFDTNPVQAVAVVEVQAQALVIPGTSENLLFDVPEDTIVDGHTIAEWKAIGEQNETTQERDETGHPVHTHPNLPESPEGLSEQEQEACQAAYIASLTMAEAMVMFMGVEAQLEAMIQPDPMAELIAALGLA